MNYSKTIREYCLQNEGRVLDVSYELKHHFSMVPYKTFLKILNRLEEEKILKKYSKGIYLINKNELSTEDPIIAFYANEYTGIVIGYSMYNRYGITKQEEKPIVIYTNAMETTTKNIGDDYKLIYCSIQFYDVSIRSLIEALELIENKSNIVDADLTTLSEILINNLQYYKDFELDTILKGIKYKYSTICSLESLLNELHIENNALKVFKDNA